MHAHTDAKLLRVPTESVRSEYVRRNARPHTARETRSGGVRHLCYIDSPLSPKARPHTARESSNGGAPRVLCVCVCVCVCVSERSGGGGGRGTARESERRKARVFEISLLLLEVTVHDTR